MQIELAPDVEKILKEEIVARKKSDPDYNPSLTSVGNSMIRHAATLKMLRRKKK